jgi:hypothetical protein
MLLFHVHLPRFGDILIWINRSKTHRTIRSKVFHISERRFHAFKFSDGYKSTVD